MSQTLYRKYRPQTFSDLLGQNHVKITLENEITSQRLAHAYLFAGPRGVGKTTTARLLARAINCQKRKDNQSEPCGTCESCQDILSARSLDLIEMDAASHTGVDNVRDNIIENARFTPSRWQYKVFIIDEAHMLSLAAFNALLKTLEEPPEYAIFILCTTEIHRLPDTIVSRCQRFDFKKINQADLVKRLSSIVSKEKIKIDESILKNVARMAEGSARDAESLLGQILTLGDKKITAEMADLVLPRSNIESIVKLFDFLAGRKTGEALDLVNNLAQEGINFIQFTKELVEFLRKILLIKVNGRLDIFTSMELTQELEKSAIDQAKNIELDRLTKAINLFLNKEREIKYSDITQLPIELAIVEICETGDDSNEPDEPSESTTPKISQNTISPKSTSVSKSKSANLKMSLEDVKAQWGEVLKGMQKENHSLALIFQVVTPEKIEGDTLILGCNYAFHADQIKQAKLSSRIEKVLKNVYGQAMKVDTVLIEGQTESETDTEDSIDPVLEAFGGKVVG